MSFIKRLDYDATTSEGAIQYFRTRAKQFLHKGIFWNGVVEEVVAGVLRTEYEYKGEMYNSYYVLDQYRGKGLLRKYLKEDPLPTITTPDCDMEGVLQHLNAPYTLVESDVLNSTEYKMIEEWYGDRRAKRSGLFLMNHIDEGITILSHIHASVESIKAFCLHPLFQDMEVLKTWEGKKRLIQNVHPYIILLVMEYRNKANSFLCSPKTDWVEDEEGVQSLVGELLPEVRDMLIADKIQNRKDFLIHHLGTHKRSEELDKYFKLWLDFLGATSYYEDIVGILEMGNERV